MGGQPSAGGTVFCRGSLSPGCEGTGGVGSTARGARAGGTRSRLQVLASAMALCGPVPRGWGPRAVPLPCVRSENAAEAEVVSYVGRDRFCGSSPEAAAGTCGDADRNPSPAGSLVPRGGQAARCRRQEGLGEACEWLTAVSGLHRAAWGWGLHGFSQGPVGRGTETTRCFRGAGCHQASWPSKVSWQ